MTSKAVPEAVSIRKAAEILSVSEMTIHRWIKRGFIKAYRVGPILVRIPRSELARLRSIRIEFEANSERPNYPEV